MIITLLGTGTPNLNVDQWGPSTIVQAGKTHLLFDCGRGTLLRMKQAGINPNLVSKLFLTHLHSDHVVGLPDLWLSGWEMGRDKSLHVWGPLGTKTMAYHIQEAFSADVNGRMLAPQCLPGTLAGIEAVDISEEVIDMDEDLKVTSFLVDHGSFRPALGYRVDYQNISVVLSGDTRFSENLVEHSKGADIIIHNAWVAPEDSMAYQLVASPEDAANVFNLIKPKLAVISHYNTEEGIHGRIRSLYKGPLLLGKDLHRITLTESGHVRY